VTARRTNLPVDVGLGNRVTSVGAVRGDRNKLRSAPHRRCVSRSARSAFLCNRHAAEGCRGESRNPRQNKPTPNPT